jgi:cyclopropane-fatty-acyl-phospholipid synthase
MKILEERVMNQLVTSSTEGTSEVEKGNASWLAKKSQNVARKLILSQLEKINKGVMRIIDNTEGESQIFEFGQAFVDADGKSLVAELYIHDASSYSSILTGGSIGAAEAYMTGDWTTPNLTNVIRMMAVNMDVLNDMEGGITGLISKPFLKVFHKLNQNTEKGSRRNIAAHYDLGNELFETFLDPSMMYSSAIYQHEDSTLEQAAEFKLKRICDALQLTAADNVVEIGTGWGGFAIYAAKNYGCHVTTTTISEEQHALAKQRIQEAGLENKITLLKQDYRALKQITGGGFDKLVSIEMIEAVGWRYYDTFFEVCSGLLKEDGVMLIQAITIEDQRYEMARKNVDFIQRYIFPGSCIPSIHALLSASKKSSDLRMSYQQDYAEHYAKTLREWHDRFNANKDVILQQGYSEDFFRLWQFYFSYCEGGFKERSIGVSHLMFSKPGYRGEQVQ